MFQLKNYSCWHSRLYCNSYTILSFLAQKAYPMTYVALLKIIFRTSILRITYTFTKPLNK